MNSASGVQSAAIGPPPAGNAAQAWAHVVSLGYRVLVPASPVILALGFGLYVPAVLSLENIINIIQQTAFLFVLTCAQTIVLLTRGLDLSLGPSVSMISVASALTMTALVGPDGANGIIAALAGTASGLLIGLVGRAFNGIAVAWLRVNPFVATLASMNICLGIGTSLSDGHPVFGIPEEFNVAGYRLHVLGVPMSIIYAVAVGIALHLLLQHTVVGRSFYVLGSNPRAAIVAGWPRRRLLGARLYSVCIVDRGRRADPYGTRCFGRTKSRRRAFFADDSGRGDRRRQSDRWTWRIGLGVNRIVFHHDSFEWHEFGGDRRIYANAGHGRDRHLCRCARPHCAGGRVGDSKR